MLRTFFRTSLGTLVAVQSVVVVSTESCKSIISKVYEKANIWRPAARKNVRRLQTNEKSQYLVVNFCFDFLSDDDVVRTRNDRQH